MSTLTTVVSGGQNGADVAALRAARSAGLDTGGYVPLGLRTDNGAMERSTFELYRLQEAPTPSYAERDKLTAQLCDALLAFRTRAPLTGRGTESTVNYVLYGEHKHVALPVCAAHCYELSATEPPTLRSIGKPVLVMWDVCDANMSECVEALVAFVRKHSVRTLMVSGPTPATVPDIERDCGTLLATAFATLGHHTAAKE